MLAGGRDYMRVREDCISATACSGEVNYINSIDNMCVLCIKIYI